MTTKRGNTIILKRSFVALLGVLLIIQFFRPAANTSAAVVGTDVAKVYPVPDSVSQILQRACYDCHSNNTRYPWYSHMQPVAWWLNDHIVDGKRHLNFSEFGNYSKFRQAKKLGETAEEVEKGDMPLDSYTWIHKDAILSAEEKNRLTTWARQLSREIYASIPPAELELEHKKQAERKRAAGKR